MKKRNKNILDEIKEETVIEEEITKVKKDEVVKIDIKDFCALMNLDNYNKFVLFKLYKEVEFSVEEWKELLVSEDLISSKFFK